MHYRIRQIIRFPGRLISEVVWGFQRATRGYSDRDLWGIDSHIASVLSKSLYRYVEMKNAVSVDYIDIGEDLENADWDAAKEKQDAEYLKYAEVFARYADGGLWESEETAQELNAVTPEEFDDAMQWLSKRFTTLWY